MNKKGVSAVVATVLVILITVAAIAIVWTTVIPLIENSLIGIDVSEIDVSIDSASGFSVYDENSKRGSIKIKKGGNDIAISKLKFFIEVDGTSEVYEVDFAIPNGESRTYYFYSETKPSSVSIAPVFLDGSVEKELDVVATAKLSGGSIKVEDFDSIPEGNKLSDIPIVLECEEDSECSALEVCESNTCEFDGDLVAYYTFDGGNADDVVGTNNGSIEGDTYCGLVGQTGFGCDFDGSGDYIDIPHSSDFEFTDFSVGFWYKHDVAGGYHPISKWQNNGENVLNSYFSGNDIRFVLSDDGGNDEDLAVSSLGADLFNNEWNFIVLTLDDAAGTISVYINEQLSNSVTDDGFQGLYPGNDKIKIGGVTTGADLVGVIDSVFFVKRKLEASEVLDLYNKYTAQV